MTKTAHFDRRGSTYDDDPTHQRIATLLLEPFEFAPGEHVLDLATGTGRVALKIARRVGPSGRVVALDTSMGMLATARRKANEAQLPNLQFQQGDADRPHFKPDSFDRIFCASAFVLMPDVTAALRRWRELLRPGGTIAFDTPSSPFGLSQRASEAALRHGVRLSYGDLADTADKCRGLLRAADFEVVSVRKAFANTTPINLETVIEMYDERIDHPAWRSIKDADPEVRKAVRADFVETAIADSVNGCVSNDVALFFTIGAKPAGES